MRARRRRDPTRRALLAGLVGLGGAAVLRGLQLRASRTPNLLLITLCSARADRVGALGYRIRDTTPTLDALARRGVLYRYAWANATWTNASHASLLTGLLPGHHRLYDDRDALLVGVPTLPGLLAAQGWRTAALVQEPWGMSLGPECRVLRDVQAFFPITQLAGWSPEPLVSWATEDPAPFFALVHLREAHLPFGDGSPFADPASLPPAIRKWRAGVGRPGVPGEVVWNEAVDPHRWLTEQCRRDPAVQAGLDLIYDAGLRAADTSVRLVLDAFERVGRLSNTIVAVVGDHGDRLIGHKGELNRPILHIPLILALPDGPGAGRAIDGDVAQVDLLPTLLQILGIPAPERLDGTSLAATLEGEEPPPRTLVTQSLERVGGRIVRRDAAVRGDLRITEQSPGVFDVEHGREDAAIRVDRASSPEVEALLADLRRQTADAWVPTDTSPVSPAAEAEMRRNGYW